jgi:hypothetical protein
MMRNKMPMKKISTFFIVKRFSVKLAVDSESYDETASDEMREEEYVSSGPSVQSVKRILDFARACDVMETQTAGFVELNLN